MGRRAESQIPHYQNLILDGFWDLPSSALVPNSRDTIDSIAAHKEYKRPPQLYHYTGIDAAYSILSGDDPCGFAFTHYRFLNDCAEYDYGLKLAEKWLKRCGGATFGDERFKDDVFRYIRAHKEDQSCIPYVLSFSTEKDSTTQWMAYTDKKSGGFAIGINFNKVEKLVRDVDAGIMDELHYDQILLAPCIYCKKKDKNDVSAFENVLDCALSGAASAESHETREQYIRWCAGRIFQFASLVKGESYRFENEWRLVIRPRNADYFNQIRLIGGKPRLKPSAFALKDCVRSLMVSPHGDQSRNMALAKLLMQKMGRSSGAIKSKSTYFGGNPSWSP